MFEKEAEEYADKNSGTRSLPIHEAYARGLEEGFQDGAEYGYNKANEWHYVKDGDLPKKELWNKQLLLLVDRNGLPPCFVVGYYEESEVLEGCEKNWGWYNIAENVAYDFIDNEISVLKWKEIEQK